MEIIIQLSFILKFSPDNLFFVLVGVRMSTFVSSDDKKPLQKSIIGFLQPGKTHSSVASQGMHQKLEKEHLSNLSSQTCPGLKPCLPPVQMCQRQEEVPRWRKQRGLEGSQTCEEPQQSFFQRAHVRRLQLQVENGNTQEEGRREDASVVTSTGAFSQKGVESSTKAHKKDCTASDLSEDHLLSPVVAHASTSGCGGTVSESLTCPVCFRQVETTDLNVFNRHIDQCLTDASRKPNQCTISDTDSDLDLENDHREYEVVDKWRGECEVEEEKAKNNEEQKSTRGDCQEDQRSSKNDSVQTALLINGDNKTVTLQQPDSCSDKGPVLICPICQLTQDDDDLITFNHHVDLCLNQEVLHELGGQTSSPLNPPSITNGKAVGECV